MSFRVFCFTAAVLASVSSVCHAGLLEKTLPLVVVEKMMISPAPIAQGDMVRNVEIDPTHTMRVVVKSPTAPQVEFSIPLPAATVDAAPLFDAKMNEILASGKPAKLVLAPGKYYFKTPLAGNLYWRIMGVSDLTIEGNGATLIFGKSAIGVIIANSKRVKISNLKVKYEGFPLASLATAVKSGTAMYMKPDADFVANYGAEIQATTEIPANTTLANKAGIWMPNAPEYYASQGQLTYTWDAGMKMYKVGGTIALKENGRYLLRHWVYGPSAFQFGGANMNEDVIFDGVTIYNSPGWAFGAYNIRRGIAVVNSVIAPDPADRLALISLASDAFHTENFGGDAILENNDFSYMGDDSVNLTNRLKNVTALTLHSTSEATLTLTMNAEAIAQGHTLGMFASDMTFLGLGTVTTASGANGTYNVRVTNNVNSSLWGATGITDFSRAKYVRNLSLPGARYFVSGNTFHHHRGRGLLLQLPVGVVEDNLIHNLTMTGIMLHTNTTSWMEGFGVALVNVRNNTIRDMKSTMFLGMLMLETTGETMRNVTVEGNDLRNDGTAKECIVASTIYNLRLVDNLCNRNIRLANSENITGKLGVMQNGATVLQSNLINYRVEKADVNPTRKTKEFAVDADCSHNPCAPNRSTANKLCMKLGWDGLDDFQNASARVPCNSEVKRFSWTGSISNGGDNWDAKVFKQPKSGSQCQNDPVTYESIKKVACFKK